MATTTANYIISPADGWTAVTSGATTFLAINANSCGVFDWASSASAPVTNPTAASSTLTLVGNAVADETVVINGTTLTWKASAANENQVTIGADAPGSVTALVAAINAHTVLSLLFHAVDGAGDTVVVTYLVAGAGGNTIATTETMTNASWTSTVMAGGVSVVDGLRQKPDEDGDESLILLPAGVGAKVWIRVHSRSGGGTQDNMNFGVIST